jgi:hypothetical protein
VALIAVLLAFFMIVEAILLTGAAITMRKPELYQRFVDLMMYWPTALVMPYMVVRNRGLQQKLVLRGAADQGTPPTVRIRRRATRHKNERAPNVSAESTSGSEPIRIAAELNEATLSAQSDLNHTLAEYRRALRLVIERSEALQQDQDMLDLILRLLSASETADQADGQARQPGAGISSVPPDEERGPLDKAKSLELHTKHSDNGLGRYAART